MARLSETYGGNFLKANANGAIDIPGNPESLIGTITKIETTTFKSRDKNKEDDKQRALTFREHGDWRLGLNVTNWKAIARFTGKDDDDEWIGVRIEMFVVPEDASKTGHAIRVRKPSVLPATAPIETVLGASGQARLESKIGDLAVKYPEVTVDQLRVYLTGKHPDKEAVIADMPALWPSSLANEIAQWIADRTIPF